MTYAHDINRAAHERRVPEVLHLLSNLPDEISRYRLSSLRNEMTYFLSDIISGAIGVFIKNKDWASTHTICSRLCELIDGEGEKPRISFRILACLAPLYLRYDSDTLHGGARYSNLSIYGIRLSKEDHKNIYELYRLLSNYEDASILSETFNPYIIQDFGASESYKIHGSQFPSHLLHGIYDYAMLRGADDAASMQEWIGFANFDQIALLRHEEYAGVRSQIKAALSDHLFNSGFASEAVKRIVRKLIVKYDEIVSPMVLGFCLDIVPDVIDAKKNVTDGLIGYAVQSEINDAKSIHDIMSWSSPDRIKSRLLHKIQSQCVLRHQNMYLLDYYKFTPDRKSSDSYIKSLCEGEYYDGGGFVGVPNPDIQFMTHVYTKYSSRNRDRAVLDTLYKAPCNISILKEIRDITNGRPDLLLCEIDRFVTTINIEEAIIPTPARNIRDITLAAGWSDGVITYRGDLLSTLCIARMDEEWLRQLVDNGLDLSSEYILPSLNEAIRLKPDAAKWFSSFILKCDEDPTMSL